MLYYVVSWPVIGAVILALVGVGWNVLSMTPPRYRIAEVCFSVAAVLFLSKFTYWAITLGGARRERILVSFLVFGLTGLLFIEGIAWIEGMPRAHAVATREVEKEREQALHVEPKVHVKVDRGEPSAPPEKEEASGKKAQESHRTENALAKIAAEVGEIRSKIDKKPQREVEKEANETAGATDSATNRKIPGIPANPKDAQARPTLVGLFKKEFPHLLKITDEGTIVRWENGGSFQFKTQIYADFPSKSQFIGFYIPTSPKTYDMCLMLADDIDQVRRNLAKGQIVSGGYFRDDKNTLDELTISGRVLLYHEDELSIPQKAAIINAYKIRHFDVQFRGPDYLIDQILAWHREHDPPRSSKQP